VIGGMPISENGSSKENSHDQVVVIDTIGDIAELGANGLLEVPVDPALGNTETEVNDSPSEKVRMALREGPSYPKDLAKLTQLNIDTVKNVLTKLRKKGEVVATGRKTEDGAEQVSLSLPITHE
jgi:hypothetical protein